jgi:hypothetical protein
MGRSAIFNLITIVFVALAVVWIIYVVMRLAGPPATDPAAAAFVLPPTLELPTLTPTDTPFPTSTPTDTLTPTITPIPSDTPTPTLSPVPSATITDTPTVTQPPSETPTPLATFTPLPSATPTGPSPTAPPTTSPYPFQLRDGNILLTQNFANAAGCAWQGLGGQVFGIDGQTPLTGLQVHVFNSEGTVDFFVQTGSNTLYGASGWEQPVDNVINTRTYFVELLSPQGTVISDRIQVTFPGDCAQNLALVYFVQTRPF